jgi:hypothetical protein
LLIGCAPIVALVCSDLSRAGVFAYVFAAFWCLFFIPLGVWLTFGRSALEIDGNSRTYRRLSRVLVVTKETAGGLDKFDKVTVSRREQRRPSGEHGNRTYTDYPIRLEPNFFGCQRPNLLVGPELSGILAELLFVL